MGNVIKLNPARATPLDDAARDRVHRFLNDEITWAEVEGMTYEQAREIARIGCDLAASGRLDDARILFEGLVAGNPRDSSAQAALGTIYQRLNRIDDARSCYDKALEQFDGNVVALANRGELRVRAGDVGGLEDLARAVQLDAAGTSAAGRRARALVLALARRARAEQAGTAR